VPNIRRAFIGKNDKGEQVLTTEGANIEAVFAHDNLLDLNRLTCNNVHDVARYYGIEAANRTIVREIQNVFQVYGITVNPRHLTLIADYMTFDGEYKPFNRFGMENNPSPLQQMTFETATGFLRAAALGSKTDALESPSSCIVVGKPCHGGTTSFSVVQDLRAGL
jgi:DNA-directed RNA polymerase I subunit RPA1